MTRLSPLDRVLAARLDEAGTPRIQIARRLGVSPAAITQLLGARNPSRATFVHKEKPTKSCPDCGVMILLGSKRCRACYESSARKAAPRASTPVPAANTTTTANPGYIHIPVSSLAVGEIQGAGGAYGGHSLTWACRTEHQAAVMRQIFAGRYDDVPSRRAFAPMPWEGLAAEMATDEAVTS